MKEVKENIKIVIPEKIKGILPLCSGSRWTCAEPVVYPRSMTGCFSKDVYYVSKWSSYVIKISTENPLLSWGVIVIPTKEVMVRNYGS